MIWLPVSGLNESILPVGPMWGNHQMMSVKQRDGNMGAARITSSVQTSPTQGHVGSPSIDLQMLPDAPYVKTSVISSFLFILSHVNTNILYNNLSGLKNDICIDTAARGENASLINLRQGRHLQWSCRNVQKEKSLSAGCSLLIPVAKLFYLRLQ